MEIQNDTRWCCLLFQLCLICHSDSVALHVTSLGEGEGGWDDCNWVAFDWKGFICPEEVSCVCLFTCSTQITKHMDASVSLVHCILSTDEILAHQAKQHKIIFLKLFNHSWQTSYHNLFIKCDIVLM